MSPIIYAQARDSVIMLYAGLFIMMCYHALRAYLAWRTPKKIMCGLIELIFWAFAGLVASSFLYYACYGKLSFHAMLALVLGMSLWRFCVSEKFQL